MNKEKFSSQPVGTQPLEAQKFAKPVHNHHQTTTDAKRLKKRRSRSRGGGGALDPEELFREAIEQKREKELQKIQTSFHENSSGVHLSELERSNSAMNQKLAQI